jgi:methyl-accepting chemotaxis protein
MIRRQVERCRRTIGTLSTTAQAIAAAVEEQGAATGEIARSVQRAARGMSEVAASIASIRGATAKTLDNADEITAGSEALAQQSQDLRREVTAFLDRVRQAALRPRVHFKAD